MIIFLEGKIEGDSVVSTKMIRLHYCLIMIGFLEKFDGDVSCNNTHWLCG